jgi:hypothetical protein
MPPGRDAVEVLGHRAGARRLAGHHVNSRMQTVPVRDDRHAEGLGQRGDPGQLGHAAAPFGVGLHHGEQPLAQERQHVLPVVQVLAGGQRDRGLVPQRGEGIHLGGRERLLQPGRPDGRHLLAPADRVRQVPAHKRVEHHRDVRAYRVPDRLGQRDVGPQPCRPAARPMSREPLLPREPGLGQFPGQRADAAGVVRRAEGADVGRHARPAGATQQLPDRGVEGPAAQVPERVIGRADGQLEMAVTGVPVQPLHLVPQRGSGQSILANQERRQDLGQRPGCRRVHRPVESLRPLPGGDPDVQGLHRLRRVRLTRRLGRLAVDVQRHDLPLHRVRESPRRPPHRLHPDRGDRQLTHAAGLPQPAFPRKRRRHAALHPATRAG